MSKPKKKPSLTPYRNMAVERFTIGYALVYLEQTTDQVLYMTTLSVNAMMAADPTSREWRQFTEGIKRFNDRNGFYDIAKYERVIALYMRVNSEILLEIAEKEGSTVTLPETSVVVQQRIFELCKELEANAAARDVPEPPENIEALNERFQDIGVELDQLEERLYELTGG